MPTPIGGLGSGNMERMGEALGEKGRDIKDLDLALFSAPTSEEKLRGRIEQGFDHLIFNLPSGDSDQVLPLLDKYATLAEQVRAG